MSASSEVSDGDVAEIKKPRFSRKLLLIIGAAVLLLVGSGVAAYLILGWSAKPAAEHAAEATTEGEGEGGKLGEVFVEVPPMVVNLRSADGVPRLIKIRLMLVPARAAAAPIVTEKLPIIIDSFQPFLRELRPEDLAGSAAVYRIKEELLIRANAAAGVGRVKDVLIQDLIQQ